MNISLNPFKGTSLKLMTLKPNRSPIWIWMVATTSNDELLFIEEGLIRAIVG
jgi:hypothetical protein